MKKFAAACFAAWLCLALCACAGKNDKPAPERAAVESGERQFAAPAEGDLIAIFDTSLGEVRAVLYPDAAPMAVENFAGLARTGYYDGTVIWRSEYGFAVQGGDATGTGTGGSNHLQQQPLSAGSQRRSAALRRGAVRGVCFRRRGRRRQQPVLFCDGAARQRGQSDAGRAGRQRLHREPDRGVRRSGRAALP